jgi:hypothetical protein
MSSSMAAILSVVLATALFPKTKVRLLSSRRSFLLVTGQAYERSSHYHARFALPRHAPNLSGRTTYCRSNEPSPN